MRTVFSCLTAVGLLACSACGDRESLYPVFGKVTYNGSPAGGAFVFFHRQGSDPNKEPPIVGIVQKDGSFEMVCGCRGKGAPPGKYAVLMEWTRGLDPDQSQPQQVERQLCECHRRQQGPDKLQGRYADPKHPRLHATVEARATILPPFEITDVVPEETPSGEKK